MEPLTEELLNKLRDWCDEEHGRRKEAAEALGVSAQTLSNWFSGQKLMGEQALRLQAFLKTKRPRKGRKTSAPKQARA
jgi:DNA-binding transcriptional regulator YiaG